MESGPSKIDLNIQLMQMTEKIRRLESLIDVTAIISSVLDLEELLMLVMEKAQTVMCARASSVLLLNEQTGRLECEVALGDVGSVVRQKVSLELGQGIAGWVAEQGEPLLVADAQNDPRFDARSDVDTGFYTQSVLAVPLKVKNKIIGVAEVLNPIDECGFTESDLQLFMTF
ncbi:GAF domain-containing protein, partial [bacterium]|nr:GAF domain-containing protein [bacterium]